MAETPEEVARRLCPLKGHPVGAWSPSPGCRCKAISSAIRAQYVAGLEAALALVPPTSTLALVRIKDAAEQAKAGK